MSEFENSPRDGLSPGADVRSLPHEPEEIARQEIQFFRQASTAERGRMVARACRAAARLDRSRRLAGLLAAVAEPWPESTWEFLKQQAARHVAR